MSFESPILLVSLAVVPVLAALIFLARRRASRFAVGFPALDVLARTSTGRRPWRRAVPVAAVAVSLASIGVALARPQMSLLVPSERATVILVLDTSRSMQSDDVEPTRLEAAKAAAQTFVDRVPDPLRIGLVTFSGDVSVAALPTSEHDRVRTSITAIDPFTSFGGGTAIGDALARAVEVGRQAVADIDGTPATPDEMRELVSILFLSDGRQNRGILPPLEGAGLARAAGIRVFTVALGDADSATGSAGGVLGGGPFRAPDPETLRAIAKATGGEFTEARTADELQRAYRSLGSRLGRLHEQTEVTAAFVALGAVALLVGALAGAWWSPRLP